MKKAFPKQKSYKISVEATDEADAYALQERIKKYLKKADKGDYSGRVVEIEEEY